ncbi:hypothetical protein JEQ12_001257 [Ovis aries]|uniref:Uncharacterized protein n=1 Tax=Ovis aries TaxID=9940 RepID=A0A836AEX1_SHEEP|nr:hypothetical protein JEQ12_001257 [Ovis aries]
MGMKAKVAHQLSSKMKKRVELKSAVNINLVNNAKSLDAYKSPALQNNLEKKVQTKIRYEPIDLSNYFDVSDLNVLADTCKYFFAAVSNSTTMNMNTHKSLHNCEKFPD